jgi:hypothetical protein
MKTNSRFGRRLAARVCLVDRAISKVPEVAAAALFLTLQIGLIGGFVLTIATVSTAFR